MKRVVRIWGLLTALFLIITYSIPTYEAESKPIQWETITREQLNIVETEPLPVSTELVLHYKPIKAEYTPREYTYEEAQELMRIAQAEAGNQGIDGMMLVMMVVLNRVEDTAFPDTIHDVIFQQGQFQPIADGRYWEVEISTDAHLALAEIEKGTPFDSRIVAFEITSNGKSLERYFKYAYTVGGHDFYFAKGE